MNETVIMSCFLQVLANTPIFTEQINSFLFRKKKTQDLSIVSMKRGKCKHVAPQTHVGRLGHGQRRFLIWCQEEEEDIRLSECDFNFHCAEWEGNVLLLLQHHLYKETKACGRHFHWNPWAVRFLVHMGPFESVC